MTETRRRSVESGLPFLALFLYPERAVSGERLIVPAQSAARSTSEPAAGPLPLLLSGNDAIAHAAREAGVRVATGYPGTPSTEILQTLVRLDPDRQVYVEWATNEKVALDVALGAAMAGARALCAMKHVGLNVAADTFMTAVYTGARAGLVIVSADDPGMHSSQNEQDNRLFARFATAPLLEPADSQEARDFTLAAFELSERFDVPVLLRTTTRVIFQVAMVHIALYFFLADGRRLIAWLDEVVPLLPGQLKALLEEFRRTSVSTLLASAATAGVQAVAALAGFLIARAPVPIFLAFATLFAAFIPAVGGALVVVIAGVLQVLAGHPLSGGFLIGWGLAVVGIIDNFVRPLFLKGGMELHAGIVFFALLGGIAAFGAIGLLLGPLIVTFLVAVMRLYRRELEQEQGARA